MNDRKALQIPQKVVSMEACTGTTAAPLASDPNFAYGTRQLITKVIGKAIQVKVIPPSTCVGLPLPLVEISTRR